MNDYEVQIKKQQAIIIKWSVLGAIFACFIVSVCLISCPAYNVYKQRKDGEAILAHAQSSREVAVAEAKAKMESSALLAQADTIRAHGIARSNQIIGTSLKANHEYLQWLFIDQLEKNPNAVFYIPTERGMPVFTLPVSNQPSTPVSNEK